MKYDHLELKHEGFSEAFKQKNNHDDAANSSNQTKSGLKERKIKGLILRLYDCCIIRV